MAFFETLALEFGLLALLGAYVVMFLGGFIKGVVGFALPMISVSGIGSLMSVEIAILALLLPSLMTNVWQALRSGFLSARGSLAKYWRIFLILPVVLAGSVQVFTLLSDAILFLVLGVIIIGFAIFELSGFRGELSQDSPKLEVASAMAGGVSGGLSGIWGPPVMVYLLSRNIPKREFVQTMGLVFLFGAIVLNLSHLGSGLLTASSAPFSASLVIPALLGMWAGQTVQDRLDQEKFRRITLFVLLLAGLNLLRRGVMA